MLNPGKLLAIARARQSAGSGKQSAQLLNGGDDFRGKTLRYRRGTELWRHRFRIIEL